MDASRMISLRYNETLAYADQLEELVIQFSCFRVGYAPVDIVEFHNMADRI